MKSVTHGIYKKKEFPFSHSQKTLVGFDKWTIISESFTPEVQRNFFFTQLLEFHGKNLKSITIFIY